MNKFVVGDIVRCKVGGPDMLIMHAAVPFNGNVATCVWWNSVSGMFMQFNFLENMLEDPSEQK